MSIHLQRKDKAFLRNFYKNSYFIFLAEYIIIGLPLYISSIFNGFHYYGLALFVFSILFSLVNTTISFKKLHIFKSLPFIPTSNIEWKSGFRRKAIYIIIAYAGCFLLSHIPFAIPVGIIIITLIICSFYTENEPEIMLQMYGYDTYMVLFKKIFQAIFMLILLISPLAITFINLYQAETDLFIFSMAVCVFTLAFSIIFKYAVYEPATIVERNVIINGFVMFSFLIPYIAPLPIIMMIYYTGKASKNLKTYLHAYN